MELWSTDVVGWQGDHAFEVRMRCYPRDVPGLTAVIDLEKKIVHIASPSQSATVSFQELNDWLERYYRQRSRNP